MSGRTPTCLDLTRLVRRAGLSQPTGIDRVEAAYLDRLLAERESPVFGLVRTGRRLAVLDRIGVADLGQRLRAGGPWDAPPIAIRLLGRGSAASCAEATARSLAISVISTSGLAHALPRGTTYLNVGHTNLEPALFAGIRRIAGSTAIVLIHDTIPLDWPEFQRPGTVDRFRQRLAASLRHAARIVVPSEAVAADVHRHAAGFERLPPLVVAPLGVDLPSRTVKAVRPLELPQDRPWFVCLGTIEPRKNHALLLDLWANLEATRPEAAVPRLFLVGRRGWRNADVFARLDSAPYMGRTVIELGDLGDEALVALLSGARGLLHPSLAEGFGLPPHEAAALGVTPVCAPLPVYRETLRDAAVYADPADLYQWRKIVLELAERDGAGQDASGNGRAYHPPTWEAHFKAALTTTC
jgi:glycosyltransferase involved in cell wall biosynthesis